MPIPPPIPPERPDPKLPDDELMTYLSAEKGWFVGRSNTQVEN
eukprot:CAMPEP_0175083810 /NCGR_PEP_ID=MMETSP0052_2-20121109/27627_1 /TAXON_ID=51329 ORGANISM="Polytomella parva, Strain SAG 63-3" /NCGR_SAMPLE_ID=MMETSP0052_2 /ASSEMBLY_ACC=CAM_ASM_000194 /LENGTH=42 /DNA_ID= /DNA_START= /DNA_END= /DNA_ORIENTATION=